MLQTSVLERLCAPLCDAVHRAAGLGRRARFAGADEPVPAAARRPPPVVSLPSPVRPDPARRARAARARAGAELHRRAFAWHSAFGTTDEAIHHAVAAREFGAAGQLIAETWVHYANAGRIASVDDWLSRIPAAVLDGDSRLLLVSRPGSRRCAAARPICAPRWRGCGSSAASRRGRSRTASLARVEPGGAERDVRLGRRVGDPRTRHALGASSRDRTRRGAR